MTRRSAVANVTIAGLETFNNAGDIDMQNGFGNASIDTDRLSLENTAGIDTAYDGTGSAALYLDTFLGPNFSDSDRLDIGNEFVAGNDGITSGLTDIWVNDTNSGFGGAFAPLGIDLVRVEGAGAVTDRSHFDLPQGPIDKGFWDYDLYLDDTRTNPGRANADVFVLASIPGQEAQELPELLAGAQNLYHQSSAVWVDRQGDLRGKVDAGLDPNGFWMQGFGTWLQQDRMTSFTLFGETTDFDVGFEQRIGGVMAGVDRTVDTSNGGNAMFGIFGGYLGSNLAFDASPTEVDYSGGTVGVYATYLKDGFYADAMFKGDFFKTDWDAPSLEGFAGYSSQSLTSSNLGGRIDIGYSMDVGSNGGYIDPFAQLTYVRTKIDDFSVIGTDVDFDDGSSLRGQIGARLGKRFEKNGHDYNIFATASYLGEFNADNSVTLTSGSSVKLTNSNDFNGANVGLGIDFGKTGDKWSGFARVNGEFSEDYRAVTGKIGARLKF